jgi:hypothetical protein
VHIAGLPTPDTELATYWHRDGVIAIFPITPGRYRIIADVGQSEGDRPPDPSLADVQAVVDQRGPGGVTLSAPIWLSSFRINERKVASYRKGRVFLAGDASHVHSPAGGQGMNTGMQDAFNLAWKLALVCHGTAVAEPLLESYSAERSAVGEKVLSDAGRLTLIATMRNPAAIAVRNVFASLLFGLSPVNEMMAQNFSETTIGYPRSPLNGPHAHDVAGPAPGQRVAPIDGYGAIGAASTPQFTLLAEPGPAVHALLAAHPALLAPTLLPPLEPGAIWLVRPDGYVACVARDPAPIRDYLDTLTATRGGATA